MEGMSTKLMTHFQRRMAGTANSDDDDKNEAAEITFQIIFYSLFALQLVAFWFVFKRGQKN